MATCSRCDHVAIVYKNPPEEVLKEPYLKTKKSPTDTYVMEYDMPGGFTMWSSEEYVDADGYYYYLKLNNHDNNKLPDNKEIKNNLDKYLLSIYHTVFPSALELLEDTFSLNNKDSKNSIYCAQFVTLLYQEIGAISKDSITNNMIPKYFYNNVINYINGYETEDLILLSKWLLNPIK
jgi:hypothetical protein